MFKFGKMSHSSVWNITADCVAETSVTLVLWGTRLLSADKTPPFYIIELSPFSGSWAVWSGVASLSDSRVEAAASHGSHRGGRHVTQP